MRHPELHEEGGLGPVERGLLERWALEHSRVTEVFLSMIPEEPVPTMSPDVKPVAPDDTQEDDK